MVFSQAHDWISTKPSTVENCTHCSISHSEEIKCTADNSLSIGEAGYYSEEQTKKKKENNERVKARNKRKVFMQLEDLEV